MILLRFEPALEEALFFLVRQGRGPGSVQEVARPGGVLFLEQQFHGTELGTVLCLWIGQEQRKNLQRLVGASKRPQGFRLSEDCPGTKGRSHFGRDLLVKRKRLRPTFQSRESLGTAKLRRGQSQQGRILQHLQSFFGFTRREFFDAEPEAAAVPNVDLTLG